MSYHDNHEEGSTSSSGNGSMEKSSKKPYNDDPTNLIVNYLPVYFTEEHLRELFSQYGHIESLIVMYNKHDYRKKSKGYGFVKFSNGVEAAAAIKGVDGTRIANKTIKVSIARPGRARRSSNVFVSRLPVSWGDEDLEKAFREFGHIVECRVLTFGDGVSRRCGFVRYDSDEEATLAMNKMKNYRPTPRDAPLQVNLSVNHSPDARNMEKEMSMNHTMDEDMSMKSSIELTASATRGHGRDHMDFMPSWMSRSEMYNSAMHGGRGFSRFDDEFMFGPPTSRMDFASMMHDPMSHMSFGGSRGMPPPDMGFFPDDYGSHYGGSDYGPHRGSAGMGHPDTMEFSKQGRSDYGWGSRNGESRLGSQKSNSPPNCAGGSKSESGARLFVQNLPEFYEESHLKQLFSSYGEIKNTTIQRDRHGKSIQCGFVSFSQTDNANNALEALDGVMLSTQTLVIHVM